MNIPQNKIRTLLNGSKPSVATRIWSTWPTLIEAMAVTGNFDYFEFVAEYSPFTQPDLENMVRAAELHGIGSMIKVDFQNRHYIAQRAVSMGFQSVLYCDHKTADEVRETIWALSPDSMEDKGRFGYPNSRWIGYTPHIAQMDYAAMVRNTVKAFMIEKQEAVDNFEEICSVPGIDMVQFGPSDFSMSKGWNASEHRQDLLEIEEYIIRTALAHGIAPRCECDTTDKAEYYRNLGVRHFCMGDEFRILNSYWRGTCGEVRKLADML
ncbi:MAG: 2-keto-3-deoxy-L-rhamnonate aldolase [Firmicutes bacterium ADurb.Bin182]|nr:MAG: 2-keto-3-deoxy-L-rhamnonate aldolase [Firmicutes bacterium ADurb.Bin182]